MDLSQFLQALLSDWVSLMSGIASLILGIIGAFRRWRKTPRWVWWTASAVCFFLASARVWTTEHRKYLSEWALHNPDLKMTYKQVYAGGKCPQLGWDPAVVIIAEISNAGLMPSIVKNWKLTVHLVGEGKQRQGILIGSNAKYIVMTDELGNIEKASWEKSYLPELTASDAIEPGHSKVGFIVFRLPGAASGPLGHQGTSIDLIFEDVTGKPYENPYILSGVPGKPTYIPGMPGFPAQ